MNFLAAVLDRLSKRGGVRFLVWGSLVLGTIVVFDYFGEPLERDAVIGMAFTYAVLCLLVPRISRRRLKKATVVEAEQAGPGES